MVYKDGQPLYKGYAIELDSNMQFAVNFSKAGEKGEKQKRSFKSFEEAQEGVNQHLKAEAIRTAKARKTKLSAYTSLGRRVNITGVHASRNSITFSPPPKQSRLRSDSEDLYPICEWVADAVREKLRVEKRLEDLKKALSLVELQIGYHYGRTDVMELTKELLANFDKTTKLALSLKTIPFAINRAKQLEAAKREDKGYSY